MRPPIPLRQLVGRLGAISIDGALDTPVAALAYDERRVVPGAVFFAMPGGPGEIQQAIPRAIERGAAAIVCEQAGYVPYRATRIRVANCRSAMATAAAAFYGNPSQQLQVVAVSGCSGRAPVAYILHELLLAAGIRTGLVSSLGCQLGDRTLPPLGASPEAIDIQELLADMLRSGCRACVLELPPEAILEGRLHATELDALVLTSIEPDAAPLPAEVESRLLFRAANGRRTHGIVRIGDALDGRAAPGASVALRIQNGAAYPWMARARLQRLTPAATRLEVEMPTGELHVRLPLPGRPNARATLAASAAALALKLPLPVLSTTLPRLRPVPGRLQPVRSDLPVHVFVDACASAGELERALRAVREFCRGRVLLLFGCGHRHTTASRPRFGEVAATHADLTILTSDNPGHESPEVIAAQVACGYVSSRGTPPEVCHDRQDAIREILRRAHAGDCVLIAGKGHLAVQEIGGCIAPFDDGEQARAALASCGWKAARLPETVN